MKGDPESKARSRHTLCFQGNRWTPSQTTADKSVFNRTIWKDIFILKLGSHRGDPDAAERRLAALENAGLLLPDPEVESLADKIVTGCMMHHKARLDALHVASAVLAGVDYVLTQSWRHIANATELPRLYRLLGDLQLPRILVCTPIQFLGDLDNDI